MITQKIVKELFNYDEETGILTYKHNNTNQMKKGDEAGSYNITGYRNVKINGIMYRVHRIVWLYVFGKFPENFIDHINGIKDDNRICNLREATRSENKQNQKGASYNNKTGYLGVSYKAGNKKYRAQININGKVKHIGYFETPELANIAYLKAKKEFHIGV